MTDKEKIETIIGEMICVNCGLSAQVLHRGIRHLVTLHGNDVTIEGVINWLDDLIKMSNIIKRELEK